MKAPLKWIQTFTNIATTPAEFAHRMTMSGSKVEGYESEKTTIRNVVCGKIVSKKRHPDADTLWICSVYLGKNIVQIVTGAQNVREGDIVPVALNNSMLPNGKTIQTGEIRGVRSEGMMCSLAELSLTASDFPECDENGIMILPYETPIGSDVAEIVGLDDTIFEFEITSNRPDCYSISGLAREAAATYGEAFNFPRPKVTKFHGDINSTLKVENQTPQNCLRYTGAVVENVRIQPSPKWLRERLRRCGVRPINNIVDITNYVMLEYNQPMHAFDYKNVQDAGIIVRQARKGETIVTLDGIPRTLTSDMTVIADRAKPLAIAGVMGGEFSGITDQTTAIIFESACFNGKNVRATARALSMRTESSVRFEKELDPFNTEPAIMRALELVEKLNAGDIVKGVADARGRMAQPPVIKLDLDRLNSFLGTTIEPVFVRDTLTSLGCKVDGDFNVTPPTFRGDIATFADLAEEVARFYGYDRIPLSLMSGSATARPTERQRFQRELVSLLLSLGLYETTTTSFMGAMDLDRILIPDKNPLRKAVLIQNPMGEENAMMRTTAIPGMMETLAHNYAARIPAVGFFETAVVYAPTDSELPTESKKLMIGAYGSCDFFTLKGYLEKIAARFGLGALTAKPAATTPSFHSGRVATLAVGEKVFATFGEILPPVSENYGIKERVYLAEIDIDELYALRGEPVQFKPLPKYPAISRDLALVCDIEVPSSAVESCIREGCGELLESLDVFDVYTGDKIPAGKKSIAYAIVLRGAQKTLQDADADEAVQRTLQLLQSVGITLRS